MYLRSINTFLCDDRHIVLHSLLLYEIFKHPHGDVVLYSEAQTQRERKKEHPLCGNIDCFVVNVLAPGLSKTELVQRDSVSPIADETTMLSLQRLSDFLYSVL